MERKIVDNSISSLYIILRIAPMAQWIKASGYGPEDWEFESSWAHHEYVLRIQPLVEILRVVCFCLKCLRTTLVLLVN